VQLEQPKIPVVDSDRDKSKKRKLAVEAKMTWERGGDEKRLHVIMAVWKELIIARIKQGVTQADSLRSQISQDQKRIDFFERAITSHALRDSRVTRHLQSATGSDPGKSDEIRVKSLEAKPKETKDKLDKAESDLKETEKNCAQAQQDLTQTKEMITICSQNYKRIIKHSPYAGIVEMELNDKKSLSIVLANWRAKAQGLHADSKH
jgi:chromosome segregation ATPase